MALGFDAQSNLYGETLTNSGMTTGPGNRRWEQTRTMPKELEFGLVQKRKVR